MSHDELMHYERVYMRLAARPYLNREARSLLTCLQSILRDHKKAWEGK